MQGSYAVRYNEHEELWTVRHYDDKTVQSLTHDKELMLEQRSRHTLLMVLRGGSDLA
jgi:aspartate kinase